MSEAQGRGGAGGRAWAGRTEQRGGSEEGRRRPEAPRRRAGSTVNARGPVVILIGPPGAGKTTVGGLLARRLGVSFTDTDTEVESTAGKPVSEIFIEDGEPAFRALERAAVSRALADSDGVVAVGGGAVLDPATQNELAERLVVYLETGFATAAKRVGLGQARPLLIGNPRATLKALLDQRLPLYERLASITVSTDDRVAEDVVADIAERLAAR
jgi:shikimate kinase